MIKGAEKNMASFGMSTAQLPNLKLYHSCYDSIDNTKNIHKIKSLLIKYQLKTIKLELNI
jgi:hypothetical protein